jgi:shikimate kinase
VPKAQARSSLVFLVGFMGAGKTSVGLVLSQGLSWPFEDLDDRIEAQEKRSIEEIFRDYGEAAFRRAESAALRALLGELGSSSRIVALGGGAIVQPENARALEEAGATVVFLDAPVEELFRRCQQPGRKRPLQRDLQQFRELYHQRRPFYMASSRCINTSGKDLEAVAAEVACSLGLG